MMDDVIARLDQLLDGQHRIGAEVAALRQAVEASRRRDVPLRRLSPADATAFAKLLPAISAGLPNVTFSVRLLQDYAGLNAPQYIALRDALVSVGGSRSVGRLLLRDAASDVPGFTIKALGKSSEGVLWNLTKVVNMTMKTHKNPRRSVTREPVKV